MLATVAISPLVLVRPTVVTAVLFALTLVVLRRERTPAYWWLVPLFAVWANLHAGFIAGLALIAYVTVMRRSKRLLGILLLCAAATLCNAYDIRIYEEIIRTLFSTQLRANVQEWQALAILRESQLYIVLWIAGFWILDRRSWQRWLGLGPLLLLASVSASRNVALFVLVTLQDFDRYMQHILGSIPRKPDWRIKLIAASIVTALLLFAYASLPSDLLHLPADREAPYPAAAVAYLRKRLPGRLYNNYNYGGYLIWKLPSVESLCRRPDAELGRLHGGLHPAEGRPESPVQGGIAKHDIQCALLSNANDKKFIEVLQRMAGGSYRRQTARHCWSRSRALINIRNI